MMEESGGYLQTVHLPAGIYLLVICSKEVYNQH